LAISLSTCYPRTPAHARRSVRHMLHDAECIAPQDVRSHTATAHSDETVANRDGGELRIGWEMSSRGRFAPPADFPRHDCSPCSHVHVRRESLGICPPLRTSFCRPRAKPYQSDSQLCLIAVGRWTRAQGCSRRWACAWRREPPARRSTPSPRRCC
jgi:hypothetical protein